MTVLGALASRSPISNALQVPWSWGDPNGTAGRDVTTSTALQLLTVYGCNRFISDGIATLPIDTFRKGSAGERIETEPPAWLTQPTAALDHIAWTTQVLSSLLLAGNAYCHKGYGPRGLATLTPLDPGAIKPERVNGRKWYRVNGELIDPFNILHIPGVMYPGSDVGLSPVEAARQTISSGMAAKDFGANFFDQDGTMPGVIETPGDLTPEGALEMSQSWARSRRRAGSTKTKLPGVLVGGATWKPTGVSNEQSQFLETQGYTASEIAGQMFLIDPSEMGLPVQGSSLTYGNLTERNERRVQVTFLPWIVRLEMAWRSLMPVGEYAKKNTDGLLRGSTQARWETYKIGEEIGALEIGEIRSKEDLPPLPDKPPAPPDLAGQIEAVGQLIRAGFDPAAALALFGLPPIAHTGLVPVTVTTPGA